MESVLLFYSIGVQFVYDSGVYPVKPFFVFCFSGAYLTGAVQIYSLNINYIASYLLIYGRPAVHKFLPADCDLLFLSKPYPILTGFNGKIEE